MTGRRDAAEEIARIRLLRSPRIGPVSYRQLLARFGGAVAAIEALPELAARGGGAGAGTGQVTDERVVAREIAAVAKAGARYLFHDDPDYPALLGQLSGAPPILTVRGDTQIAARPVVAMVGARNASAAAVRLARQFAGELAEAGYAIASGLARGIDAAAHQASLNHATIGVIASGIDLAYPPENAALQEEIAARGLLIAEQPPGTEPLARHFPSRNRIIAGLAVGTLVVEAAWKSGSLITARVAAEAGREVMAIPGSPLEARAQGCNQLIREGAVLVQSAADVIELITGFTGTPRSTFREDGAGWEAEPDLFAAPPGAPTTPEAVAALLTTAPVAVDELIRQSGAGAGAVHTALLELELAGKIERHAGGRVSAI